MTNYETFKAFLESLAQPCGICVQTKLHETSYDTSKTPMVYVYDDKRTQLAVIDMDTFSQKVFTRLKYSPSELTEQKDINKLAMSTVDALLIDKNNEWFFIEFKNQKISNSKDSVSKKAYQNYYLLMSLFYDYSRNYKNSSFSISNPLKFAKNHITYILVVSEEENQRDVQKMHNISLAGEYFRPDFMDRLRHYLFKDAYVYLPSDFERDFVNKFEY